MEWMSPNCVTPSEGHRIQALCLGELKKKWKKELAKAAELQVFSQALKI
jgi:hypothetical protein